MPLEVLCPICGATYNLRDEMKGKTVRCKKCEHPFKAGAPAADKGHDEDEAIQPEGRPVKVAGKRARDEEDRPRKTRPPAEQARRRGRGNQGVPTSTLLIAGGAALALLLVCGGVGGFLVYRAFRGAEDLTDDMREQAINRITQQANANGEVAVLPGLLPAGQQPANLEAALEQMKSPQHGERAAAVEWLAHTPLDKGRQAEVSAALVGVLNDPDGGVKGAAARALVVWATPDSAPALTRCVEQKDGATLAPAVETLARLKDERGAVAVANLLPDFFQRERARNALQSMGPVAEKGVVKYYFHPDGGAREAARGLTQGYGTREGVLIKQAVEELNGGDHQRRRLAAEWLASAPLDPALQPEVARALDPTLADRGGGVVEWGVKALAVWATADNVPSLIRGVEDDHFPRRHEAMAVLGKLKDGRAAPAVAARLTSAFDWKQASDALIAMGPVAKDEVMKYLNHNNRRVRDEAVKILGTYGVKDNLKLTQLINDLKSPEGRLRSDAARALQAMPAEEARRADVARALDAAAANTTDRGAEQLAIKALAVWGDKDSVPGLLGIVEGTDGGSRHAAMETLARLKDERAVKTIALRLLDFGDRSAASKALQAMGADLGKAIEAEVWPGLVNPDRGVRVECCRILAAVGTRNSIVKLERAEALAVKAKQRDVALACQDAITSIKARGK
jgi:predicted Zn finger-like uncharacterized protein